MKVAVVLTCFNRKEKTQRCIETILKSKNNYKYILDLRFFVCDDKSTDGTYEALQNYGSLVEIVVGTGNLFWARGMARAMTYAEQWQPDYYMMVNDDVEFKSNAIEIMFESYFSYQDNLHAIVGATQDSRTGEFTYGGYIWNWKAHPKIISPVYPYNENKECNTTNWNCFLISRKLYEKVGNIDVIYEHSYADFDYSNRITLAKYKIYTAYDYIGKCARNDIKGTWRDKTLSIRKRIQLINKPTGFPPKSSWHYCKKYYGPWAVYMFVRPYLSIMKDGLLKKIGGR